MQISTRIGVVQVIGVLLIPMHRIHWVKFGAQAHWEARGHHVRHARFMSDDAEAVVLDLVQPLALPDGSFVVLIGRHGAMNPAGSVRCNIRPSNVRQRRLQLH
jgi:hypothetical protein